MIIGIAGAAGSGKDTVAGFISKYSAAVSIAQADSMKRFAATVFGFTEHQLWGPSDARNGVDERYLTSPGAWGEALRKLHQRGPAWVDEILPDLTGASRRDAFYALEKWFHTLARAHGYEEDRSRQPLYDMKAFPMAAPRQLTPRYVLQTLGTEYGRQFSPSMWNDYTLRAARKLLGGGYFYTRDEGGYSRSTKAGTAAHVGFDPEFVVITDVRFRNEIIGIHGAGGVVINVQSPSESNAAVEAAGVKGHRSEAELKGIPQHWFDAVIINDKSDGLQALESCVQSFVNRMKSSPPKYSTSSAA